MSRLASASARKTRIRPIEPTSSCICSSHANFCLLSYAMQTALQLLSIALCNADHVTDTACQILQTVQILRTVNLSQPSERMTSSSKTAKPNLSFQFITPSCYHGNRTPLRRCQHHFVENSATPTISIQSPPMPPRRSLFMDQLQDALEMTIGNLVRKLQRMN